MPGAAARKPPRPTCRASACPATPVRGAWRAHRPGPCADPRRPSRWSRGTSACAECSPPSPPRRQLRRCASRLVTSDKPMVGLASRKTRRGYLDDETGSATAPLFVPQAAVVHIKEAGAQEESKPEPLAPGTLGNERLEQVVADTFGNTWSIVFDAEDHLGSRGAVRFQPDPDGGALTPMERVQGVAQQTADHFAHHMPGQVDPRDFGDFPHHSNPLLIRGRQECR